MSKEAAMHSILAELINATSPGNEQMRGVRKLREALPGLLDQYRLHIAEVCKPADIECKHNNYYDSCFCYDVANAAIDEYYKNIVNLE